MHTHMTHYLITNEPQIYSGREWHWETQTATATCKRIKLDRNLIPGIIRICLCVWVCVCISSVAQSCPTLCDPMCMYNGILFSHEKKKILPFATTWLDLEGIMLGEISQREKDKHQMMSLTCVI